MCRTLLGRALSIWVIVFLSAHRTCTLSYNQPKFCPFASWNPTASTVADNSSVDSDFDGTFVDDTDTIFIVTRNPHAIQAGRQGDTVPTKNISYVTNDTHNLFATGDGDLYIDNGANGRVDKWLSNTTIIVPAFYVSDSCYGLFVDINNTLYCSMTNLHQVVINPAGTGANVSLVIAGNGTDGSDSALLHSPRGIFVDADFSLYVADSGNDRIQLFRSGQPNGTSVTDSKALGSIVLHRPVGVILDSDGYLFILDSGNSRVIGSSSTGFRCLVGCSSNGSAAHQLQNPTALFFDSYGNLFVTDGSNGRIQKFRLATNSCVVSYNQPKFSSCASWDSNAWTFASSALVGVSPFGLFVDASNTLYVNNRAILAVRVWTQGSDVPTRLITNNGLAVRSIFVSINGDTYSGSGSNGLVTKAAIHENRTGTITSFNSSCFGLFIDLNHTIYCAMALIHLVAKRSLLDNTTGLSIVSGTGVNGSTSDMFNFPCGIFVDTNFTVYIADTDNHRIQRFYAGEGNGTTIAGAGVPNTSTLNRPHAIVLDGDGYLFIIELGSHRLTVSGPNGFQCVAGCNGVPGSASNQLSSPVALALDSYGNIFVSDRDNNRVQKFILATNTCLETTTAQKELTTTVSEELSTNLPTTSSSATTTSVAYGQQNVTIVMTTDATSFYTTANKAFSVDTSSLLHPITRTIGVVAPNLALSIFIPPTCSNPTSMGLTCNISNHYCHSLQPCLNNGTCLDNSSLLHPYICLCLPTTNGSHCQFVHRPCQPTTCWNNGICRETSNRTFNCTCAPGWSGLRCQMKIDYCESVRCQNNGVCRSLFSDYQCECLSVSYSGRYCEIASAKMQAYQAISKSLGYIAIIAITSTVTFVLVMDVLKYCVGIDPARGDLRIYRQQKEDKKRQARKIRPPPSVTSRIPRIVIESEPTVLATLV